MTILPHERGLVFRDGVFEGILRPGRHWVGDPLLRVRVDVVSVHQVRLEHPDLGAIARSGALAGEAEVVCLRDHDRGVVWVDGHVEAVLGPGLYALWTVFHEVLVDVVDARVIGVIARREEITAIRN
jgi:hypothetical protein